MRRFATGPAGAVKCAVVDTVDQINANFEVIFSHRRGNTWYFTTLDINKQYAVHFYDESGERVGSDLLHFGD